MLQFVDDFETFSRRDLRDCNLYVYAAHESTGVHCLSYALPTGEVCLWRPGMEFPFADDWEDTKIVFSAFNAEFEIEIWNKVCTRLYGWPELDPDHVECLQAKSSYAGLPRKLSLVAKALGFGNMEKDTEGHRVMMRLSRPQKAAGGIPAPMKTHGVLHGGKFDRDPVKIERMELYCRNDTRSERLLDALLPDLPDSERKLWAVHRRINERGVPVDVSLCRNASKLAHRERGVLGDKFSGVTGIQNVGDKLAINKLAKMKVWMGSQGVHLPDMQKETVEEILSTGEFRNEKLPSHVMEVLTLRSLCKDAAVAKYDGILCHVNDSSVCQGAHVFYKAGPGRFAGAGVNFLNLKRLDGDRIEENCALADRISKADEYEVGDIHEELSNTKAGVIPTLGGMIRLAVCARPGKMLLVRDYKAIEMRVLHWLAGDEAMLKSIADFDNGIGEEPYKLAAARIYRKKVGDVTKAERQTGKVQILGCFAADTLVLTNHGAKPIVEVRINDKLWDGVEWVNHDGLLPKGNLATVSVAGVCVTPEHEVLSGENWTRADSLQTSPRLRNRALAVGWASLRSLIGCYRNAAASRSLSCVARAWKTIASMKLMRKISFTVRLPDAIRALSLSPMPPTVKSITHTATSCPVTNTGHVCSTEYPRFSHDAKTKIAKNTTTTGVAALGCVQTGKRGTKPIAKVVRHSVSVGFCGILRICLGGITRYLSWIVLTTIRDTSLAICDLLHGGRTCETRERYENSKPVYDLMNAGPRSRFTILTRCGPLLVHNCGYLSGAPTFSAFCQGYGIDMPLDRAKILVQDYRRANPLVKRFWYRLGKAATNAIKRPGKVFECGIVSWLMSGRTLTCRLPSGRELNYYAPKIFRGIYGDEIEAIDQRNGRRRAVSLPILVENVDQAISRDLLADALIKCDAENISTVLHVYDEIVIEIDENDDEIGGRLSDIMRDRPSWASDLPIDVDGGAHRRYVK